MGRAVLQGIGLMSLLALCAPMGAAAQTLPDVVETHDGGMVRGTIVERRPDGSIVLVDARGEVREFSASQVRSAAAAPSSAASPPPPPQQPQPASDEGVEVHFTSEPERLVLEVLTRRASVQYQGARGSLTEFETLCAAPCVGRVPDGPHTFSVRLPDGAGYAIRRLRLDVTHPLHLHVRVVPRTAWRRGLAWTGVGLMGLGLALILPAARSNGRGPRPMRTLAAGLTLGSLGLAMSFSVIGFRRPRVYFSVLDHPPTEDELLGAAY